MITKRVSGFFLLSSLGLAAATGIAYSLKGKLGMKGNIQKEPEDCKVLVAAVEIGGTYINVAKVCIEYKSTLKSSEEVKVLEKERLETSREPLKNAEEILEILKGFGDFFSIGICSFGPIVVNPLAENYGEYLEPPSADKKYWKGFNLVTFLKEKFPEKKVSVETDVNAPAYSEFRLGGYGATETLLYVTIGTGVGVGVVCHGRPIHGLIHPEAGHFP